MTETDDVEALRAELAEERRRREEAEQIVSIRERAIAAGVPSVLAANLGPTPMSDERLTEWAEGIADYVEQVRREARPDLYRGRGMVVQHAPGTTSPGRRPGQNGRD